MEKQITSHAAAAALIRAELKKNGIKARVRARTASMMTAVDVDVYADLCPAARHEVEAFVARFQYGTFDGMTDCYNYTNRDDSIPQVKYTNVTVHYSEEIKAAARARVAHFDEAHRSTLEWQVLTGAYPCDFWAAHKPRVRVA